jgi:hypothetical protein
MKRTMEEDLAKLATLHERITAGGDEAWELDKKHPLNKMLDVVPVSDPCIQFALDADYAAHPLVIDGKSYGTLGAPNVPALLNIAQPAGFGHNAETKHDKDVRNAYEIEGARVKVKKFYEILPSEGQNMLDKFAGTPRYDAAKLTLYKVHIYPPGGHFAVHVDTPHGPGHIASAVCVLGSAFTGGALVIEHQGKSVRVEKPGTFAAWYTDCKHWIEKVESGHRVVLQFDIFNTWEPPLLPAERAQKKRQKRDQEKKENGEGSDEEEEDQMENGEGSDEEEEEESSSSSSREDEGGFWARYYSSTGKPLAGALFGNALVAQMKAALVESPKRDIALMLQHAYFNKGGLSVETLKGGDKVLWSVLAESGLFRVLLRPVVLTHRGGGYEEKDSYSVGTLIDSTEPEEEHDRAVRLIPGEDGRKKTITMQNNPGAEHTGNSAMDADCAYLGAALVCRLLVAPAV